MAQETGVQSQIESYQRLKKWYLILLNPQHYKVWVKCKVKQSRETSITLPYISVVSSYWKGSFQVSFDCSRQLYLLLPKSSSLIRNSNWRLLFLLLHSYWLITCLLAFAAYELSWGYLMLKLYIGMSGFNRTLA